MSTRDPAAASGVLLVGANPGVRLFEAGEVSAVAFVWQVDWSIRGSGRAIVLWCAGEVRVLATDDELGRWLEREFTRHFPEVADLAWPEPTAEEVEVTIELDLATGMTASAGDVEIRMGRPLDVRAFATDRFPLAGVDHALRLVLAPVGEASISVAGRRLPGRVDRSGSRPEKPASSAFMAVAEVWAT